jgi:hypothetical protein
MREGDWELCKELARFLAAMDETGETLKEAMSMVEVVLRQEPVLDGIGSRLQIPVGRFANGSRRSSSRDDDGTESDRRTASETGSIASTISAP